MKKKEKITYAFWFATGILLTIIFAVPLYSAVVNSFRSVYSSPVITMPKANWINYKYAVTLIPFFRYLMSSLIIVGITVFFAVTFDFFYGYAFARLNVPGNKFLFLLVLSQMMIPGVAMSIPQYITFANFGIKDTYWIWVMTGAAGNAYAIFRYKQFIELVPRDIEEAAFIDGCGFFRIITQIYMPMCKNIMVISMFSAITGAWSDYMTPYMYLTHKKYPLAIALFNASYQLPNDTAANPEPIKLAAAILFSLPMIILFFACQKQLTEGITSGAVKG